MICNNIENIIPNVMHNNLFTNITPRMGHSKCIWFRNNGENWHTLFKFENKSRLIHINNKLMLLPLPELMIHVSKINNIYDADIYFKNRLCNDDELINSFLVVKNLEWKMLPEDHINDSVHIIKYLLTSYNFEYDNIEEYLSEINPSTSNKFDHMIKSETKLSDLISYWTVNINNNISKNIIIKSMIKKDKRQLIYDAFKSTYTIGKYVFTLGQMLKIKNEKYVVNEIKCRNYDESIIDNFERDSILLYNKNDKSPKELNIKQITDIYKKKLLNITDNIPYTDIYINDYVDICIGESTKLCTDIVKFKYIDNWIVEIYTELYDDYRDKYIPWFTYKYDCLNKTLIVIDFDDVIENDLAEIKSNNHTYSYIFDKNKTPCFEFNSIYKHIGWDREKLIKPFEIVQDLSTNNVTIKKLYSIGDKKHYLHEMFSFIKGKNVFINKLSPYKINQKYINKYNMKIIFDFIYSFDDIKKQQKHKIKKYIHDNNGEVIDTKNIIYKIYQNIFYIDEADTNINITDFYCSDNEEYKLPFLLDEIKYSRKSEFISLHPDFDRDIVYKLKKIVDGPSFLLENERNEKIKIKFEDISDAVAMLVKPFDNLKIGQYGKLSKLKSIHGFKKSNYYKIEKFVKIKNNSHQYIDAVLFCNGLYVARHMIDSADFKDHVNSKYINNDVFNQHNLSNSNKYIKIFFISRNNYNYTTRYCVIDHI